MGGSTFVIRMQRRTIYTIPPWGKRISLDSRMSDANNIGQSKRSTTTTTTTMTSKKDRRDGAGDDYDEILPGDVTHRSGRREKLGIF